MTPRLGRSGYSTLKLAHLVFSGTWLGSGLCLLLVGWLVPRGGEGVGATPEALQLLDLAVTVPSAVGSLLTGVLFSSLTPWGFVRHRWVVAKYLINLVPVVAGGLLMAPWLVGMLEQVQAQGAGALGDPLFQDRAARFSWFVRGQLLLLLGAVALSGFKPRLGQAADARDPESKRAREP